MQFYRKQVIHYLHLFFKAFMMLCSLTVFLLHLENSFIDKKSTAGAAPAVLMEVLTSMDV